MNGQPKLCDAILLAGRRPGGDALARELGLSDKWLLEIGGKQMLSRVLEALEESGRVRSVTIVTQSREAALKSDVALRLLEAGRLEILQPELSPANSVLAAVEAAKGDYPCLLTTADHALLSAKQVRDFLDRALAMEEDFVAALADVEALQARFPEVRRTAWRFRGEKVAGCNLFLLRTPAAKGLVALWRGVEADRKRPLRILRRFGFGLLLAYLAGRLSLADALERLGALAGCRVAAITHPDPLVGIDVDNLEDLDLVERILAQRPAEASRGGAASQPETMA